MISSMAKTPKKSPPVAEPDADDKKPMTVYLRLDDDTAASLMSFIDSQTVEPSAPAVTMKALRKFLTEQGHYPPPKGK